MHDNGRLAEWDANELDGAAPSDAPRTFGFDTRAIHAGQRPDPYTGSRAVPIFQTTSYVFEDPESASAYFNLQEYGNTYARIMNPTVATFEERVASLEGAVGGVAFASGLAAQGAALFTFLQPGDHVVSSSALYGGSVTQLKHLFRKLSVELTFVDPDDLDAWRRALKPNTKALYGETIGNPGGNVLDIEAIARIAHEHETPLMIDNTFASPYLCRPKEWGADIVVHSATKYLGGHGNSIAGIIVDSGKFDWAKSGRFPDFVEPDPSYHGLSYTGAFGNLAFILKARVQGLRDTGACLSPFNAFLILQGIETLHLRVPRHAENALAVAKFLEKHPDVEWVNYPGLASSKYNARAKKYLPNGASAIVTFGIKGGFEVAKQFQDSLELFSLLANIGDAKSLVIHPASTTHQQLSEEEQLSTGVTPNLIRLCIGIEDIADITADLENALAKTKTSKKELVSA
jgi:O-acetylhomoserine (thiol)-lyase